jgi:integrase
VRIHDQYGKLAENALIEALAERHQSSGSGAVSLQTPVTALVEQHLVRLAEDGRSPVTLATYRFAVGKLAKFIGGVRVGEASPALIDAALRSMRSAHGPTMARQAKTILRGALQLAVMANVLGSNPVRDVQPLRSRTQPKGAVGLTAEQLRDLLQKVQASKFCQDHDLVVPITLLIATGLRRSELLGLRWSDYDDERARSR